jgi:hypothetical protein
MMQSEEPSTDGLAAMGEFATAFEAEGFAAGEWTSPERQEDGAIQLCYWSPSEQVILWEQAVYDLHIVDSSSDYMGEDMGHLLQQFQQDPSLLLASDLATVRAVVTNIVRGERFCDGYMAGMFESGVAQAATRRLGQLAQPRP